MSVIMEETSRSPCEYTGHVEMTEKEKKQATIKARQIAKHFGLI